MGGDVDTLADEMVRERNLWSVRRDLNFVSDCLAVSSLPSTVRYAESADNEPMGLRSFVDQS